MLLVTFAVLSLILASVLVATSLNAMLARQVREIGVMKTLGARTSQLFGLYALLVGGLSTAAALTALPLGLLGARVGARAVANMLNFDLADPSVPMWVFVVQAASGIILPLAMAFAPINRATRASIRDCIEAHGVVQGVAVSARLPSPIRNLLRRPKRLALTLLLLATGGALFIAALSVAQAWERNLDKMRETRHYDVEVRLHQAAPAALDLAAVSGVKAAEWWGYAPAAFARDGQIDTVRTYPDRGHGSLTLLAPPPATQLIAFPLLAGRWLRGGDNDNVVLNHVAAAQGGGLRVGAAVLLSANGKTRPARVVGIVEEVGAAGVVYMDLANFRENFGEARLARASTLSASSSQREDVIRRLEQALATSGASVEAVIPFAELRTAVGDHVIILVRALGALAAVLALVGLLGLTSAVTTGILERTREIGVMKALGASRSRILRMVLSESLLTATLSAVLALLITLPVTAGIESMIGRLGFLAPLPFVISLPSVAGWLGLVGTLSIVATWLPARRAAAIPVRRALSEL